MGREDDGVAMNTTKELRGTRVLRPKGRRKIGKIIRTVFHPTQPKVVGFIVKRPDLLWMFKRKDRFLAFDRYTMEDGRVRPSIDKDSWDEAACARLGIDYDLCILWEGMPIRTSEGRELGGVGSVTYDAMTGKVSKVVCSDGGLAKALLGTYEFPVALVHGYQQGYIVLDAQAALVEPTGGVAAKAGEFSVKASKRTGEIADSAGKKTGEAMTESAKAWGSMAHNTKLAFRKASGTGTATAKVGAKSASTTTKHTTKAATEPSGTKSVKTSAAVSSAFTSSERSGAGQSVKATTGQKEDAVDTAAKKLGGHLAKSKGMFSAFKEEYKKGSRGR
jgi:uncharacterized protein YrrD